MSSVHILPVSYSVSLADRELEPARSLQRAEDGRETVGARDFIIRRNSFPVPQSSPGCLGGGSLVVGGTQKHSGEVAGKQWEQGKRRHNPRLQSDAAQHLIKYRVYLPEQIIFAEFMQKKNPFFNSGFVDQPFWTCRRHLALIH